MRAPVRQGLQRHSLFCICLSSAFVLLNLPVLKEVSLAWNFHNKDLAMVVCVLSMLFSLTGGLRSLGNDVDDDVQEDNSQHVGHQHDQRKAKLS